MRGGDRETTEVGSICVMRADESLSLINVWNGSHQARDQPSGPSVLISRRANQGPDCAEATRLGKVE